MVIYLIMGESGEYSDRCEYPICWLRDRGEAEAWMTKLNRISNELWEERLAWRRANPEPQWRAEEDDDYWRRLEAFDADLADKHPDPAWGTYDGVPARYFILTVKEFVNG